MPFASQKQKRFLKWKFPKVYEKYKKEEIEIKGDSHKRGTIRKVPRRLI